MEEYESMSEEESIKAAMESFLLIQAVAKEKNIDKAAVVFYGIVKRTYALAKEQDLLEKDKEQIDRALKGTQALIMIGFKTVEEWTEEMIEEFNDKVKELWVID